MKAWIFLTALSVVLANSRAGLLRVPKVYNAVITSDQNLAPSRAYPVIQPVIHRTAIGYVPPFYYTQIAPQFTGPEVVHLPYNEGSPTPTQSPNDETKISPETEESSATASPVQPDVKDDDGKKENDPAATLSFYPNYRSLYYEPYFYSYNTFNPHPSAGTYYVDYQPYGPIAPLGPTITSTNRQQSKELLPDYRKQENPEPKEVVKEKIPDVPPPPLPTAVPKNS